MTFNQFCHHAASSGIEWASIMARCKRVSRTQIELWALRFNRMMGV